MPRSVNAVASRARRKRILKAAKGFYGKRKNVYTVAKNIVEKGQTYSYVGGLIGAAAGAGTGAIIDGKKKKKAASQTNQ